MNDTVISEIEDNLKVIGEVDIRRVQRVLEKPEPDEKPLGTLHNETLKKLWALANHYRAKAHQAELDVSASADSEEEAEDLKIKSMRFTALEEAVRQLFWIQAQDDIGIWQSRSIGLRADWLLVSVPDRPEEVIGKLLGGIIRPVKP